MRRLQLLTRFTVFRFLRFSCKKMSEAAIEAPDAATAAAEQIKSFRDFLYSYNKLSELCFNDCVWDFTSRTIKDQENNCAVNCAEKFLKANQRMSQRFQEFQMIANENALAALKKVGS